MLLLLVSCKSENPAAERLNLSFDTVSLDSGGRRRDAAQEDDSDFYSGNSVAVFGTAGSSLQNGVAAPVTSSSSSYSEALTPVTNKVSFIIFTEWASFYMFLYRPDRDPDIIESGPGTRLDWNPVLKTAI